MTELFISAFVTLFLVIDPIGVLPMFIALTQGLPARDQRLIALRATAIAFGVLLLFIGAGESVLNFVGISMGAFRIAGGILLFLTAIEMLFERRTARREKQAENPDNPDPSVFPLATPLIAGPGAIAAVILLAGNTAAPNMFWITAAAAAAVLTIALALFLIAPTIERILGPTGINVTTRLLGMLLAAFAAQIVIDGLADLGVLG